MRDRIREAMAVAFDTSLDAISDDAAIGYTEGWDSLGHLHLMLELESRFGVKIPTQVMIELQSLDAIERYLTDVLAIRQSI